MWSFLQLENHCFFGAADLTYEYIISFSRATLLVNQVGEQYTENNTILNEKNHSVKCSIEEDIVIE